MNVTEEFVEMMICPACQAKVKLKADASGIKCVECGRVYPIRNDIPSMMVEEATIEDEDSSEKV